MRMASGSMLIEGREVGFRGSWLGVDGPKALASQGSICLLKGGRLYRFGVVVRVGLGLGKIFESVLGF